MGLKVTFRPYFGVQIEIRVAIMHITITNNAKTRDKVTENAN